MPSPQTTRSNTPFSSIARTNGNFSARGPLTHSPIRQRDGLPHNPDSSLRRDTTIRTACGDGMWPASARHRPHADYSTSQPVALQEEPRASETVGVPRSGAGAVVRVWGVATPLGQRSSGKRLAPCRAPIGRTSEWRADRAQPQRCADQRRAEHALWLGRHRARDRTHHRSLR